MCIAVASCRQGQFLNVRGEKTSEKLFYDTLSDVAKQWDGVTLKDYCCVDGALAAPYLGGFEFKIMSVT